MYFQFKKYIAGEKEFDTHELKLLKHTFNITYKHELPFNCLAFSFQKLSKNHFL